MQVVAAVTRRQGRAQALEAAQPRQPARVEVAVEEVERAVEVAAKPVPVVVAAVRLPPVLVAQL